MCLLYPDNDQNGSSYKNVTIYYVYRHANVSLLSLRNYGITYLRKRYATMANQGVLVMDRYVTSCH